MLVYELSGCGFESSCCHLNYGFCACFKQEVPWHSGNYRVWVHSETRTWHDRNIQSILLMITDGKRWHYLAMKKLAALLWEITSKHEGDFYCLNYFRSYSTEKKLKKHHNVCKNHDYCDVEMPNEDNKILKYKHGESSIYYLCWLRVIAWKIKHLP